MAALTSRLFAALDINTDYCYRRMSSCDSVHVFCLERRKKTLRSSPLTKIMQKRIVIVVYHREIMAEKLINTQQHKTNVPLASAGGHLPLHGNIVAFFRDSTYENISNRDKIKQARGLSH